MKEGCFSLFKKINKKKSSQLSWLYQGETQMAPNWTSSHQTALDGTIILH